MYHCLARYALGGRVRPDLSRHTKISEGYSQQMSCSLYPIFTLDVSPWRIQLLHHHQAWPGSHQHRFSMPLIIHVYHQRLQQFRPQTQVLVCLVYLIMFIMLIYTPSTRPFCVIRGPVILKDRLYILSGHYFSLLCSYPEQYTILYNPSYK